MLAAYTDVVTFLLVAVLFIAASLFLGGLLRPHHPYPEKLSPYECGKTPIGSGQVRFKIRYYIFALVFLVFDVEALFLYAWAVILRQAGWPALWEGIAFVALLFAGLIYAWRKKVLKWV